MQVGDILRKKTARVATVRMNETVAIAAQLMRSSNISALVVKDVVRTEGNTAVGMFTERDVVRAIAEHGAAGVNMQRFAIHFGAAARLLHFDGYARACPSPHEQASHPPRACHRQLQPDRRHQHPRHLDRVRRRSDALQAGRVGLTGRFGLRRHFWAALPGKTVSHRNIRLNACRKAGARKSARRSSGAGKHHLWEGAWRVTF